MQNSSQVLRFTGCQQVHDRVVVLQVFRSRDEVRGLFDVPDQVGLGLAVLDEEVRDVFLLFLADLVEACDHFHMGGILLQSESQFLGSLDPGTVVIVDDGDLPTFEIGQLPGQGTFPSCERDGIEAVGPCQSHIFFSGTDQGQSIDGSFPPDVIRDDQSVGASRPRLDLRLVFGVVAANIN